MENNIEKEEKVTVCDKCETASCWYGEFMCQESGEAGTKEMTIAELEKLNLESPHFWSTEKMNEVYGETLLDLQHDQR